MTRIRISVLFTIDQVEGLWEGFDIKSLDHFFFQQLWEICIQKCRENDMRERPNNLCVCVDIAVCCFFIHTGIRVIACRDIPNLTRNPSSNYRRSIRWKNREGDTRCTDYLTSSNWSFDDWKWPEWPAATSVVVEFEVVAVAGTAAGSGRFSCWPVD